MSSLGERWPDFLALVRQPDSTGPIFAFVADLVDEAIGSKLTTATVFDVPNGRLRRIYTQNSTAYPVGGFKPIPANRWTETLITRRQIYTALTIEAIAEDFIDWELIRSLGCESIANLPIVIGGQTVGALNLLHRTGYYTAEKLERAGEIMPFLTMAYLATLYGERGGT